jgi:hypothetical protein
MEIFRDRWKLKSIMEFIIIIWITMLHENKFVGEWENLGRFAVFKWEFIPEYLNKSHKLFMQQITSW